MKVWKGEYQQQERKQRQSPIPPIAQTRACRHRGEFTRASGNQHVSALLWDQEMARDRATEGKRDLQLTSSDSWNDSLNFQDLQQQNKSCFASFAQSV